MSATITARASLAAVVFVGGAISAAQDGAWQGLPPDCWSEPRMVHDRDEDWGWASRTRVEQVTAERPESVTHSPNRAYFFALASEPPYGPILIYAEKEHFVRISFADLYGLTDVKWINEKLLYFRAWWGRIAATDIVFDVEAEEVLTAEAFVYGAIAMEQARDTCRTLGGCRCIQKEGQP